MERTFGGVSLQRLEQLATHFLALQPDHRLSARDHAIVRHAVQVLEQHDCDRCLLRSLAQLDDCDVLDACDRQMLRRAGLHLLKVVHSQLLDDRIEADSPRLVVERRTWPIEQRGMRGQGV